MVGMRTCYWRQGELERVIPGPHHQDNAYKTLWLIHYFHANPEPIFHFNEVLDPVFLCGSCPELTSILKPIQILLSIPVRLILYPTRK